MPHILLLDRKTVCPKRLHNHIRVHGIDCQHLHHSMVVFSNSLDDLIKMAQDFIGVIIENIRLVISQPLERLFIRRNIEELSSLQLLGRYGFTDPNSYGDGVVVANIDDGVYTAHPEFSDRFLGHWFGINPMTGVAEMHTRSGEWVSEHGTHTMGTICGLSVGSATRAKWTFLKLFNSGGADLMDMFKLVELTLEKFHADPVKYPLPHVFNCSFGAEVPPGMLHNSPELKYYADALQHMYDSVRPYGSIFLYAAGNSATYGNPVEIPSFFDNSISVGSVNVKAGGIFERSIFSSYGNCIDAGLDTDKVTDTCPVMVAPGQDILSCVPLEYNITGYAKLSGTSMATPAVAGLVACMFSFLAARGISRLEAQKRIVECFKKPSSYVTPPGGPGYGLGLVTFGSLVEPLLNEKGTLTSSHG